ncbi:serine hydrolase [Actinocatenispora thailandica]|uniref:Serine hydrolase n=1 Tax=Actinocatenispora thailandica TaxID=227318 RepID=A0A7R7DVG3_9ACTN|nr:serine hydrolase domain-containing protein [Actinocatenispora thailandica]BCJ38593.1 serine hydrolase [Actinocatenispora thailandica]
MNGTVAAGYEPVREQFAAVVAAEPGLGAQLAVYRYGRLVVDLSAGMAADALTALYSTAKGAAHLVVAWLVQHGALDLDRTVSSYWPQFTGEGKEELTLRDLLAHRSGVIGVDGGLRTEELADDRVLADRLASQRPYWRPGRAYGYHAFVIGALTGEVVRRATGHTIQQHYQRQLRAPFGLDFHLGLPATEEPRYVPVQPATESRPGAGSDPTSLTAIAFNQHATPPTDLVEYGNTRLVRALGPASSGGVGSARGLAGLYAAAVTGLDGRPALLHEQTVARFARVHSHGTDLVTGERDHFALGFEAQPQRYPFLGARTLGHSGAIGAHGFADAELGLAYGYTRRRFVAGGGGGAPENQRLALAAVHAARRADRGQR